MNQKRSILSLVFGLIVLASSNPAVAFSLERIRALTEIKKKADNNEPISIKDFPGFLDEIKIPPAIRSTIENITIRSPKAHVSKEIFFVSGTVNIKGMDISAAVIFKRETGDMSLKLALPKGIDFKQSFPELGAVSAMLTTLKVGQSYFIFSDYDYKDTELNIPVEPGFNFGAGIDLTGPLQKLKEIIDRLSKTEFLIAKDFNIVLGGVITKDIINSHFNVIIPYKIGIDFTKRPFTFKDPYLRQIYTAGLIAEVDLTSNFKCGSGFFVVFKNQKEPLKFWGEIKLEPVVEAVAITAWMEGMYEHAFGLNWLALGPRLGLGFGIMAVPPWVDDVAFTGGLSLGKVIEKASVTAVVDITNANLLVEFSQEKLNIEELIKILVTIAKKVSRKDIKLPPLPIIEFRNLYLKIAPVAMEAFGNRYSAGIAARADVEMGKFKGGIVEIGKLKGGIDFDIPLDPPKISVRGTLQPFQVTVGGIPIFKISGIGPDTLYETKDDVAMLELGIVPYVEAVKQKLFVNGIIEIPPLKFKSATTMRFDKLKLVAESETKILDSDFFTGKAKVFFDPKHPENFDFLMLMDKNFNEKFHNALDKLEQDTKKEINKLDKRIAQYERMIEKEIEEKLKKRKIAELRATDRKIAENKILLNKAKAACAPVPWHKKLFTKPCLKIPRLETEIVALETYKHIILKPGTKIAEKIVDIIELFPRKATELMHLKDIASGSVTIFKKIAQAIVDGDFYVELYISGKDLKELKLPKVSIQAQIIKGISINIKDLQLDLKNPKEFFNTLVDQIIDSFKKKK